MEAKVLLPQAVSGNYCGHNWPLATGHCSISALLCGRYKWSRWNQGHQGCPPPTMLLGQSPHWAAPSPLPFLLQETFLAFRLTTDPPPPPLSLQCPKLTATYSCPCPQHRPAPPRQGRWLTAVTLSGMRPSATRSMVL